MSEEFKKYKESFKKNNYFWQEIESFEYTALSNKNKNECRLEETTYGNKYYKKVYLQLTDEELNQFIQMELLENTKQMNNKQGTIKNIMIFWVILTIINLIGSVYLIIKMASLF